jgi:hypothetical protein
MGKTVRTMQGKEIDMEKLTLVNELTPAVGNYRVNARGDELGDGGQIVRTREEIMADYYNRNPRSVVPDNEATKPAEE